MKRVSGKQTLLPKSSSISFDQTFERTVTKSLDQAHRYPGGPKSFPKIRLTSVWTGEEKSRGATRPGEWRKHVRGFSRPRKVKKIVRGGRPRGVSVTVARKGQQEGSEPGTRSFTRGIDEKHTLVARLTIIHRQRRFCKKVLRFVPRWKRDIVHGAVVFPQWKHAWKRTAPVREEHRNFSWMPMKTPRVAIRVGIYDYEAFEQHLDDVNEARERVTTIRRPCN